MPEVDIVVSESPKATEGGPTFLPDPLFPFASSRLYVKNLAPGNPTYIEYSLAGAGPTLTPFGEAWLAQPLLRRLGLFGPCAMNPYIALDLLRQSLLLWSTTPVRELCRTRN